MRLRFSPCSALVLTFVFVAGALCASPGVAAEPCGDGGAVVVTADFDGDGTFDSATLRDDRIALSLSDHHTTIQLNALFGTTALAAVDLDHDGDTDLVSVGMRGSLRGWNNRGAGAFVQWTTGPPSSIPSPRWTATSTWSPAASFVPSILSGRSPYGASITMRVASGALRPAGIGVVPDRDRTTGDPELAGHSPRAPPQTFTSQPTR